MSRKLTSTWIAPNGSDYISIYDDGFIEFGDNVEDNTKLSIQEMTAAAVEVLEHQEKDVNPEAVFELMGWTKQVVQ